MRPSCSLRRKARSTVQVVAEQDRDKKTTLNFKQTRFEAWAKPPGAHPPRPGPPHWWTPLAVGEFSSAKQVCRRACSRAPLLWVPMPRPSAWRYF